ncbi:hypothetical protein K493DRAFT_312697 [Basidiobolus meristosporus CBS 931.73]|uniref:Uncharacterized protein n=1 Tax=Basidiobolus meristosporus CBS 931.73 TaxID=1314790 RepID=A0A1Y1YRY8_9FUNG|nr:hypothetical protein K493DRAFT_312697 [Basidiobolus meristosporus CBS 931.73]|eukprot:ORY00798.1 hypothetical protein K493DRAFT_312697 [Basidiobolus meristosporus CBS 931.73]
MPSAQSQSVQWVYAKDGEIPPNAVQGGVEADGQPLYIGRQRYEGGEQVGKVAEHIKGLSIAYGNKEVIIHDYYVLCGDAKQLRWVECSGAATAENYTPLQAGKEADGNELYITKTRYEGGEQVGKSGAHLAEGMAFGYGGKAKSSNIYYVLCVA